MYDYSETIQRIENLDWHQMLHVIRAEIHTAERNAFNGKPGCVRHRNMGAPQYAVKLKALAFFLGQFALPAGASPEEIAVYQRLAKALVEKEQVDARVLQLF